MELLLLAKAVALVDAAGDDVFAGAGSAAFSRQAACNSDSCATPLPLSIQD